MSIDFTTLSNDEIYQKVANAYSGLENPVIDEIFNQKLPAEALDKLTRLQTNIYWKAQDLDKVLNFTHRALDYVLSHPDATARHSSALYYNLASFTAPWWSDSLEITPELAKEGFNAAQTLVQLREEYNFETIKQSGGKWIFACHYLYTKKDFQKAVQFFEDAKKLALLANDEKLTNLLHGNSIEGIGRAKLLLQNDEQGREDIANALEIYEQADDDYSIGEANIFLNSLGK